MRSSVTTNVLNSILLKFKWRLKYCKKASIDLSAPRLGTFKNSRNLEKILKNLLKHKKWYHTFILLVSKSIPNRCIRWKFSWLSPTMLINANNSQSKPSSTTGTFQSPFRRILLFANNSIVILKFAGSKIFARSKFSNFLGFSSL